MKLNLAEPISTEQLQAILGSVGNAHLLQGTIYQPLMQLLLAPSQDNTDALLIWELTQKFYDNKNGELELSETETRILRTKLDNVAAPWLKARLLDVLK